MECVADDKSIDVTEFFSTVVQPEAPPSMVDVPEGNYPLLICWIVKHDDVALFTKKWRLDSKFVTWCLESAEMFCYWHTECGTRFLSIQASDFRLPQSVAAQWDVEDILAPSAWHIRTAVYVSFAKYISLLSTKEEFGHFPSIVLTSFCQCKCARQCKCYSWNLEIHTQLRYTQRYM